MNDHEGSRLFDVLVTRKPEAGQDAEVRLGLRCVIAGEAAVLPISPPCSSVEQLRAEAEEVRLDLDRALERGRTALVGVEEPGMPGADADLPAEELWRVLEAIPDDGLFVGRFNEMEEAQRKKVAEHVLTSCSVFSGRPALFSSRYDAETALLED